MDLDAYFARINYSGPTDLTLDTLRALHRAHLLAIPFENLDIHARRRITLDEAALVTKLVTRRRGGFCYELNGLFSLALRALGFDVTLIEARVTTRSGGWGIPFDHLALVVALDERWLADVGFGENFRTPIRLDVTGEQDAEGTLYRRFRVAHDGTEGFFHRQDADGIWHARYQFFLAPRTLDDFRPGCDYHQASPESSFTRKRVISQALPDGLITLTDSALIVTRNGQRDEIPVEGQAAFDAHLLAHFGIHAGDVWG